MSYNSEDSPMEEQRDPQSLLQFVLVFLFLFSLKTDDRSEECK